MPASLNYKSNLLPAGITDSGYNANAKRVACWMDEMYLAADDIPSFRD
jgi:hypothetical protein